jgi:tetraacyldisaccharide 4'-kinase
MRAPDFWRHDGGLATLLSPLAWGYGVLASARRGLTRPQKAACPVVCVGNLVAGGAGKTPVALAVGQRLIARGRAVHFLSRGYGGAAAGPLRVDPAHHDARAVGDEPLLLAARAPAWVARNRPQGARAAVAAGAEVIVMDDGFQNRSLVKDLSLVVIDGDYGFGNGRLLPAGPLREPVARGLARADAVVVIGEGNAWRDCLAGFAKPILHGTLEPTSDALAGQKVLGFAGIAHPQKFFATLEAMGCELVGSQGFADHHVYSADEIMTLVEAANAQGAVAVTTEKDHVRLPIEARPMVEALAVEIAWRDPPALDGLLGRIAP